MVIAVLPIFKKSRKSRFLAPLSAATIAATELVFVSFCEVFSDLQNGTKISSVALLVGAERGAKNRDFSICIPTPASPNLRRAVHKILKFEGHNLMVFDEDCSDGVYRLVASIVDVSRGPRWGSENSLF